MSRKYISEILGTTNSVTINYAINEILCRVEVGRCAMLGEENWKWSTTNGVSSVSLEEAESKASLYGISAPILRLYNELLSKQKANIDSIIIQTKKINRDWVVKRKGAFISSDISTFPHQSNGRINCWISREPVQFREDILRDNDIRFKYDINSCHLTIANQVYKNLGGIHLDAIQTYLDNKDIIRTKISEETGINVGVIKSMITGMNNGMDITKFNLFSKNYKIKRELSTNETILKLNTQFKQQNSLILEDLLTQDNKYTNMAGATTDLRRLKVKDGSRWKQRKGKNTALSFVMTGIEAHIQNQAITFCNLTPNKFVSIYDGFYIQNDIDINELILYIKQQTGFSVNYSKEII
jgi:hypothetical protein